MEKGRCCVRSTGVDGRAFIWLLLVLMVCYTVIDLYCASSKGTTKDSFAIFVGTSRRPTLDPTLL